LIRSKSDKKMMKKSHDAFFGEEYGITLGSLMVCLGHHDLDDDVIPCCFFCHVVLLLLYLKMVMSYTIFLKRMLNVRVYKHQERV